MNILICDTAAFREAPEIEAYLAAKYPANVYVIRGVNATYCTAHGTQVLQQADIDAADAIIFAESYHYQFALDSFPDITGNPLSPATVTKRVFIIDEIYTGAAAFREAPDLEKYMTKVELKLLPIL